MRLGTDAFLTELTKRNRTALARANVLYGGQIVASGLAIVDGNVVRDRRRSPRATCNITFAEPTRIPTPTAGVLSPLGYELQIYCGMEIRGIEPHIAYSGLITDDVWVPLTDGSGRYIVTEDGGAMFVEGRPAVEELLSLAIMPIQRSVTNGLTYLTRVTAQDRTQWLLDDVLEADLMWPDATGGDMESHVERLIRTCPALSDPEAVPALFGGAAHSPPTVVYTAGTAKWDIIERAASSVGYEAYFDGAGQFRWGPPPNLQGEVAWDFKVGNLGDIVDIDSTLDREPMYNKVIALGGSADDTGTYRGEAVDDNPLSPTRYGGGASKKQLIIRSSLYTSNDDAQAAAEATLEDVKGIAYQFDLSTVPNPLIEEGDVCSVTVPGLDINTVVAIFDSIDYDLSPENTMGAQGRSREEILAS